MKNANVPSLTKSDRRGATRRVFHACCNIDTEFPLPYTIAPVSSTWNIRIESMYLFNVRIKRVTE